MVWKPGPSPRPRDSDCPTLGHWLPLPKEPLSRLGWACKGLSPHLRLRRVSTVGIWKNRARPRVVLLVYPLSSCTGIVLICRSLGLGVSGLTQLDSGSQQRAQPHTACGHRDRTFPGPSEFQLVCSPPGISGPSWNSGATSADLPRVGGRLAQQGRGWAKAAAGVWRRCLWVPVGAPSVPRRLCLLPRGWGAGQRWCRCSPPVF